VSLVGDLGTNTGNLLLLMLLLIELNPAMVSYLISMGKNLAGLFKALFLLLSFSLI